MNDVTLLVVAALAIVWVVLSGWKDWLLNSVILGIIALVFSAGFGQTLGPVRFVMMLFAALLLLIVVATRREYFSAQRLQLIILGLTACSLLFGVLQFFAGAQGLDSLFRYTVLFPLMLVLGNVLSVSGLGTRAAKLLVYAALVMAFLAIFERLRGSFLVAGSYENAGRLLRDGTIRSIVFAEHPLVLSVLLIAAVPFVRATFKNRLPCFLAYLLLAFGIVATNSRGAITLTIGWFLLTWAFRFGILGNRGGRWTKALAVGAVAAGFLTLLFGTGAENLSSTSAVDASAEYRSSLYYFAAQSMLDQPWGWGWTGLPEGVYVASSYFGPLDIARTIDSEVALVMFDFGWIGLLGFLYLVYLLTKGRLLKTPFGQSALLVTASGTYLALHAWVGLGSMWFLLIGLAIGSAKSQSVWGNVDSNRRPEVNVEDDADISHSDRVLANRHTRFRP